MLKSLYDWVLGWADRKHGPFALSLVSFAEASFFPIPPDPLLMALCLGNPRKSYRFALYCSVFSILGAAAGYLIGYWVWELVGDFFTSHIITAETLAAVSNKYSENVFEAVLAAAFTPIPFKAFTVTAGVFKVDFLAFIAACAVGRTA
ncbi:MAG: DedA family protein, partial [Candidatus Dadabacteria bacterium]|nr:DedA family protein [Candidatus Dadabacteria bacterium]